MRGQKVRMNPDGNGEVDENFWAQAAADQATGRTGNQEDDDCKLNVTFGVITNATISHERWCYPFQHAVLPRRL